MADEAGGKKKGWLSKVFMGALKIATIGVASAVAWQMFMDPLFFLPIHDPTNVTMQAWVAGMNDWFGWIPELVGAKGGGGLLGSEFGQNLLSSYFDQVAVGGTEQVAEAGAKVAEETVKNVDPSQVMGLSNESIFQ